MKELLKCFVESLEDSQFSKSENKAIKSVIESKKPTKHELAWLRSHVYDLVKSKMSGFDNQQLIEWLEKVNKLLLPGIEEEFYSKAYFSPGSGCLNAVLENIGQAVSRIDVCVFTISDNRIKDRLLLAHKKGVRIEIITDNNKTFDAGSDIKSLSDAGIPVKIDTSEYHMHHKFAVIDNKIVLTGSFNWTRSAAEYNQENLIVTNDSKVVKAYSAEFKKMWTGMVKFE